MNLMRRDSRNIARPPSVFSHCRDNDVAIVLPSNRFLFGRYCPFGETRCVTRASRSAVGWDVCRGQDWESRGGPAGPGSITAASAETGDGRADSTGCGKVRSWAYR